ncbi:MAG: hypothetical protein KF874_14565 [Rhizobiaceae bacterium]|nr:hypothetical protein [Rhizobiaceae bacterium]
MSGEKKSNAGPKAKNARLAAELRANLLKRKNQARQRKAAPKEADVVASKD